MMLMVASVRELLRAKGLKYQLVRGGIGSLIIRAAYTLLSFGIGVLLARLMGAADYGIYSYVYAIIMVLAVPAQFGLPMLVLRETAQALARQEWGKIRGLWQWGTRISLLLSVIITSGAFLFLLTAGERIDLAYRSPLYWGLVLLPLIALSNQRGAALRGLQKIIRGQLPEQVIVPGFFLLLVLTAVFVFSQKLTPSLVMMFQVLAAFCALNIGAILLLLSAPREIRSVPHISESKSWLASSFSLAMISGMQIMNKWVSIVILGLFVPSAQIGIYRVAVQLAVLADFGLQVINPVIAPQIARLYALGDMQRLQRLATQSARVVLIFNLLITAGFLLFGHRFIQIFFGSEFLASYNALLILLVGGLINSLTGSVAFLLNMTGHEKVTLRARVMTTAFNMILNLLLSPVLGMYGAAIGTSASLFIWNILLWRLVRKFLKINSLAFGRSMVA